MLTLKVKVHLEGGGSGSLLKAVQISKVFVNLDIISYENKPGNAFCLVFREIHQFFTKGMLLKLDEINKGPFAYTFEIVRVIFVETL